MCDHHKVGVRENPTSKLGPQVTNYTKPTIHWSDRQYTFDGADFGLDYQLKELSDDAWKQLHVNQEENKLNANDTVYDVAMAA